MNTHTVTRAVAADEMVAATLAIPAFRLPQTDVPENPGTMAEYLIGPIAGMEHEDFAILLPDNRYRVLRYEEQPRGTIDGGPAHSPEVVKAALAVNTAAVILAHNHPTGITEPRRADPRLTVRLTDAPALIDARIPDHIVAGGTNTVSFVKRGSCDP